MKIPVARRKGLVDASLHGLEQGGPRLQAVSDDSCLPLRITTIFGVEVVSLDLQGLRIPLFRQLIRTSGSKTLATHHEALGQAQVKEIGCDEAHLISRRGPELRMSTQDVNADETAEAEVISRQLCPSGFRKSVTDESLVSLCNDSRHGHLTRGARDRAESTAFGDGERTVGTRVEVSGMVAASLLRMRHLLEFLLDELDCHFKSRVSRPAPMSAYCRFGKASLAPGSPRIDDNVGWSSALGQIASTLSLDPAIVLYGGERHRLDLFRTLDFLLKEVVDHSE